LLDAIQEVIVVVVTEDPTLAQKVKKSWRDRGFRGPILVVPIDEPTPHKLDGMWRVPKVLMVYAKPGTLIMFDNNEIVQSRRSVRRWCDTSGILTME